MELIKVEIGWMATSILLLLLGLALLLPLGKYARKVGEPPQFWVSLTILVIGFIWVGLKYLKRSGIWESFVSTNTTDSIEIASLSLRLFISTCIISLIIYLIIWWILWKKGKKRIEQRIQEIGNRNPSNP